MSVGFEPASFYFCCKLVNFGTTPGTFQRVLLHSRCYIYVDTGACVRFCLFVILCTEMNACTVLAHASSQRLADEMVASLPFVVCT